ncbi:MAG: CerR family C-terminal domain-containing protein [Planctomycetota bacterium]
MQADPHPTCHGQARERLLEAAAALFAERGFESVSIREIASRAGVRHGGVNYHFQSKRALYLEVLERFGPQGNQLARGGSPDLHAALQLEDPAAAPAALQKLITSHLRAINEPLNPVFRGLIEQEMKRPDGPDESIFQNIVLLRHKAYEHLLTLIAPHLAGSPDLRLYTLGIASQCLIFMLARPCAYRLIERDPQQPLPEPEMHRIAEFIMQSTMRSIATPKEKA